MPELPEVESVRLALVEAGIVESRIIGVKLNYPKAVLEPSAAEFVERLRGRVVLDAGRRAKYLYFPLDEGIARCPPTHDREPRRSKRRRSP